MCLVNENRRQRRAPREVDRKSERRRSSQYRQAAQNVSGVCVTICFAKSLPMMQCVCRPRRYLSRHRDWAFSARVGCHSNECWEDCGLGDQGLHDAGPDLPALEIRLRKSCRGSGPATSGRGGLQIHAHRGDNLAAGSSDCTLIRRLEPREARRYWAGVPRNPTRKSTKDRRRAIE